MRKDLDKYVQLLKKSFKSEETFSTKDAQRLMGVKISTLYWILYSLNKEKKILRVARGIYKISSGKAEYVLRLDEATQKSIDLLKTEGIKFVLTGWDVLYRFFQHQPNRRMHLIYIYTGAGTWALELLKKDSRVALLNPSKTDIENAFDLVSDNDIYLLKENKYELFAKHSIALLERAFVDLYIEVSRDFVPFSLGELAYILTNIDATQRINAKGMIRYAQERKIHLEIKEILQSLSDPQFIPHNKRAVAFVAMLKVIR